jgi:hypothetical protein
MEALQKLARYLQTLNHQQFKRFIMLSLGSMVGVTLLLVYFMYNKQTELVDAINQLQTLSKKSVTLVQEHRRMIQEEQYQKEILDKNRDFTIKGFFEQFCKENDLIPEQGWDTRIEAINDQFEAILLTATFKNQTMEKLIKILIGLDQKEIVYIKELNIHNQGSSKITFDLTIATRKYKGLSD